MPTLTDLNIPIKWGGTTQYYDVKLGTDITMLELPVLEGGVITNKTYDLPTGGETADVIISVEAANYEGYTCELYIMSGASVLIDSKVVTNGKTRFDCSDITGNVKVEIVNGPQKILKVESGQAYVVTFKHTTKIYVTLYSAANDTVLIEDEFGVSTEVTNESGIAENIGIAIDAYNGSDVKFTSTIAKSLSSEDEVYSKVIHIDENTTEVWLTPVQGDKLLYWYGYRGAKLQSCTTRNGWGTTGDYSWREMTWNANNIASNYASGNYIEGVGSSEKLTFTNAHCIAYPVKVSSNVAGYFCILSQKKYQDATTTQPKVRKIITGTLNERQHIIANYNDGEEISAFILSSTAIASTVDRRYAIEAIWVE